MDNGKGTRDNGGINCISFKAVKKQYTPTGLYLKPGNHKCELNLDDCKIDPIINGNITLMISTTGHGPICITGNREEMTAKLWELLARVDSVSIQAISQAIPILEQLTTITPDAPETAQAVQTLEALRAIVRGT